MISTIRRGLKSDRAKNVFVWIIIAALASGFLVFRKPFMRGGKTGWLGSVDGDDLSYGDFALITQDHEQRIRYLRERLGFQVFGKDINPRASAFNQMVSNKLVNKEADDIPLYLDTDYIIQMFSSFGFLQRELSPYLTRYAFDSQYGLNERVLANYLNKFGLSVEDFEQRAENAMKRQMIMKLLEGSVYVPEFLLKERYMREYLARKFSVLVFDFGAFLKDVKKEEITKGEIKSFFDEKNKLEKRYWIPEKRSGVAYQFNAKGYGIYIDDDAINSYYENNKSKKYVQAPSKVQVRRILFKVEEEKKEDEVREKVQKVRAELSLDPTTFEAVAKKLSEDDSSAKQGGLLPFFAKGEKELPFDKASFLLENDGDISDIIRTSDGFEIIQRVSRKMPEFTPLSKVKEEIKTLLEQNALKEKFVSAVDRALRMGEAGKKQLEDIIRQASRQEDIPLQEAVQTKQSEVLFKASVERSTYYFEGGKGYLVQLKEIEAGHFPQIDLIEETVKNDIYEKRAAKKLNRTVAEARKQSETKSFDEIHEQYKPYIVAFDKTGWIKSTDTEKLNALRAKGYPVEQMLLLEKAGGVDVTSSTGYWPESEGEERAYDGYLFRINEIEAANDEEFKEKKADLVHELFEENARLAGEDFIAFLRKKATIKVNKKLINL